MDYKEEYEAMVKKCRELHESGNALTKQQMEIVCPQLKESEDERIIKWLIAVIEEVKADDDWCADLNKCDEAIAWLEKKKEQQPAEWSEEDEKKLDSIISILDNLGFEEFCKSSRDQDAEEDRLYYKEIQCLKRLKSLCPQPHWKPSEKQIYSLGTVVKGIDHVSVGSVGYNLKELYEQLKKL